MPLNLKETIIQEKQAFKFSVPIVDVKQSSQNKNDPIQFYGQASTTSKSATGHKMNPSAIMKMKQTAVSLPMFWDHDPSRDVGDIVGVKESLSDEFWPIGELAQLTGNDYVDAPIIKAQRDLTSENTQVGMSIGGSILKAKFIEDMDTDEWWIEIDDVELHEVSLTKIPAVAETRGKTKPMCKSGICDQIAMQLVQNIDINNLKTEFNQSLEDDSMSKEVTISKEQYDATNELLQFLKNEKEKEIKQKALDAEKQKETELITRITQEVSAKFEENYKEKEENLIKTVSESAIDVIKEQAGFMFKNREHVQESVVGTLKPEGTTETIAQSIPQPSTKLAPTTVLNEEQVEQRMRDSVNYPSVVFGQCTEGYKPDEFVSQVLGMA